MTPRLTTNCAKNYCYRTLIVKVIVENVVTCFLLGHSVVTWISDCITQMTCLQVSTSNYHVPVM